jgi:integrase
VSTGCREQEVCRLRWDYKVKVPELDTSVFIIPKDYVKNGGERLVVVNPVARSVVDSMRGLHPTHVFEPCLTRAAQRGQSPAAAEKVCETEFRKSPASVWLRRRSSGLSA